MATLYTIHAKAAQRTKRLSLPSENVLLTDGPLFQRLDKAGKPRGRLSPQSIRAIIQRRAQDAGIGGRVSGHSLRVGSAQSLATAGASVVELQTAGRWQSPSMPGRYARGQLTARGTVASCAMVPDGPPRDGCPIRAVWLKQ